MTTWLLLAGFYSLRFIEGGAPAQAPNWIKRLTYLAPAGVGPRRGTRLYSGRAAKSKQARDRSQLLGHSVATTFHQVDSFSEHGGKFSRTRAIDVVNPSSRDFEQGGSLVKADALQDAVDQGFPGPVLT